MKIHMRVVDWTRYLAQSKCGLVVYRSQVTDDWSQVTCKNCLRCKKEVNLGG